jgi:recombination protein RecT
MATNQGDLKNAVARQHQNAQAVAQKTPVDTVAALFRQLKPQLEQALPKHLTADRLLRVALFQIRNNQNLMKCDPMSLVAAVTQSAQLGLEPGILGHAYFVPYGNQVQFILGYKGMIELARRSGNVKTIEAHEVYAHDEFEYEYGLEPKLSHKPALIDRGKVIAYYGVAHFNDGGYVFTVMSLEDIEKYRKRSRAANNGPWQTDYDAMALKTVIRRMFRWLPVSIEMQEAMSHDGATMRSVEAAPAELGGVEIIADYAETVTTATGESINTATGEVTGGPDWEETHPFDDPPAEAGTLPGVQ